MRLPPLNAVRAFEAVYRHSSIVGAAEELGVVRGAVRQQIAVLENHFGQKLLVREGRRLVATMAGKALAEAAGSALSILQRTSDEIEGRRHERLRLGVPSAFAIWWLMPRIAAMQAMLGDIEIVPLTIATPLAFHPDLDAVIMGAEYRKVPGVVAVSFMPDEFGPVATPTLAAEFSRQPASMARTTLLASRSVPHLWDEWSAESETPAMIFDRRKEFEDLTLTLSAARSGLGVTVAPRAAIGEDLARGVLVAPFGFIRRAAGYSFCCRVSDAQKPAFAALLSWLKGTANEEA